MGYQAAEYMYGCTCTRPTSVIHHTGRHSYLLSCGEGECRVCGKKPLISWLLVVRTQGVLHCITAGQLLSFVLASNSGVCVYTLIGRGVRSVDCLSLSSRIVDCV